MNQNQRYDQVLQGYFSAARPLTFGKAESILSLEEKSKAMFYIADGYVRVYSVNSRGEQYTHVIYGKGEIFPLAWMVPHKITHLLYESLHASTLMKQPLEAFMKDMQKQPELAFAVAQQTVSQYALYSTRIDNLEYKYASERVAYRLILLANKFGVRDGDRATIIPIFTHQLIGSTINLSRESVSREMEKLARQGLISYNSERQIVLHDMPRLSYHCGVPLNQGLSLTEQ